jgi:uncharacterized protein
MSRPPDPKASSPSPGGGRPHRSPCVLVAVHDVAPSTLDEVVWLLERLDELGVTRRTLLAIPEEDGRAALRAADATASLLAAEIARGGELVQHGLTHRVEGRLGGPWPTRLRGHLMAPDVAEFLALEPTKMVERLVRGRSILAEATGVEPSGFCAPGWLSRPGLAGALRTVGFAFDVGLLRVHDLTDDRWLPAPSVGYMGAAGLHEALATVGGGLSLLSASWLPGIDAIQVFLHPQGASRSPAAARALAILERLLKTCRPISYAQLIAS